MNMNKASPTSVHLASLPRRGSPFRLDGECDLERIMRVKSKSITAGQIACREMAQLNIDQSTYHRIRIPSYWHPPFILSFGIINYPLFTQLVLISPIYFVFSLIMRIAHVWHSLSANIQAPHLVQRITGSWVSVDSAKFFVPTAWHLRHWKTLNPSWLS